jgi:putative drug exporter of the RND superfamily
MGSGSLAGLCARRPGLTILWWVVGIVVAAVITAALLSSALSTEMHLTANPESTRAAALAARVTPPTDTELFVVVSPSATVDDPGFRSAVEDLQAGLTALGPDVVAAAVTWYQVQDPSMVSADRRATLVQTVLAGAVNDAPAKVAKLRSVAAAAQRPGFTVVLAGDASVAEEVGRQSQADLVTGGLLGFAVALLLLVVLMGGVVALSLPLALNFAVATVGLAAVAVIGQAVRFSALAAVAVSVLGLALAINHTAIFVARYRDERAAGRDVQAAVAATGATVGRTAVFGGLTVCLGLCGLLLVPATVVRSIAGAAILVVLVATAATVTFVPAMLSLLGDRVDRLAVRPLRASNARSGVLHGFVRSVVGAPAVYLAFGLALLLGATSLLFGLRVGTPSPATLPPTSESARALGVLAVNFPTLVKPVEVAVAGNLADPAVTGAIDELVARMAEDRAFGPATVTRSETGVALVSAPLLADPTGEAAYDAVSRVRDEAVPVAFAGVATEVRVGGATARFMDETAVADRYLPLVVVIAMAATFVVLALALRSWLVPLVAVVLNLLVAGAAFGVMRLVFQEGVGAGVLGLQLGEQLWVWIPLLVYGTLFALSLDSFLFVASRVRERYDGGADARDAAVYGVRTAGAVMAGASLVLLPLLIGMASGRGIIFQQGAFTLAVALVLDAVVVRMILLPACLALLGRSAWGGSRRGARLPEPAPARGDDAWTRDWSGWPAGAAR